MIFGLEPGVSHWLTAHAVDVFALQMLNIVVFFLRYICGC